MDHDLSVVLPPLTVMHDLNVGIHFAVINPVMVTFVTSNHKEVIATF